METNFTKIVFLAVLLLPWASHVRGEELNFLKTFELARENALDLNLARYQVDIALANKEVASARLFPQINLFGQRSENDLSYDNNSVYQDMNYPGTRVGLSFRQPILNASDFSEAGRQKFLLDLSRNNLVITENRLLDELLRTFLDVLLTEAVVEQIKTEIKALVVQLREAQALYVRKLIPVTQVLETQARLDTLRADATTASADVVVAKGELSKFVGGKSITPLAVKDRISLMPSLSSEEDAVLRAIQNSLVVASAEVSLAAARKGVDRERGSWIPNIDLVYNFQHSDVGFDNLSSPARDTSTIALGFNYPIFEGGAGAARLRGAWAEVFSAEAELKAARLEVEAEARTAWLRLEATGERVLASRRALSAASKNVEAAEKAVKAGTARVTDVLLALAQKTRAEGNLNAASAEYALTWTQLELATGASPKRLAIALSAALH